MTDDLLQVIATDARPLERGELVTVVRVVASALATRGGAASHAALSRALGEPIAIAKAGDFIEPAQLYDAVAASTSWRRPAALQLAQSVLVALARALGPSGRRRLSGELPPHWARLLEDPT
ncbi:MAG TPA: hypothetical protein VG755_37410 [Nannocystaceae bacterium]|nr:hypothetical protein [Nannocystaceae bacterium]